MIEFMDTQLCMELKRLEGGVEDLGKGWPCMQVAGACKWRIILVVRFIFVVRFFESLT